MTYLKKYIHTGIPGSMYTLLIFYSNQTCLCKDAKKSTTPNSKSNEPHDLDFPAKGL